MNLQSFQTCSFSLSFHQKWDKAKSGVLTACLYDNEHTLTQWFRDSLKSPAIENPNRQSSVLKRVRSHLWSHLQYQKNVEAPLENDLMVQQLPKTHHHLLTTYT